MKKILLLLLALWPLVAPAQRVDNPRTVVRSCEKCTDVLYYIKVIVPAYTYSADSAGRIRFQRDILAGAFDLYTDAGVKIPKGTKPPRIMPTGSVTTPVVTTTGPVWASLRYSLNAAGLFYIEGAGTELARLKFERADGTTMAGRNDDNPSLSSGTFYGYGPNPNQGLFDRQWKIYFTPAVAGQLIKLTIERSNGETFVYSFTPSTGADRLTLFTASTSSGTPASTTTTSYPSFSRVLVLGNSISTHSASTAIGWLLSNGMAASSLEQDYAHLTQAGLRAANSGVVMAIKGQGSSLEQAIYSSDDQAVDNTINNLLYELRQSYGAGVTFDLIIWSTGENMPNAGYSEAKHRAMLDKLFAAIPTNGPPVVVMRSSSWAGNESADAVHQNYASAHGYKFVDLSPIRENQAYQAWYTKKDSQGNPLFDQNGNPAYLYDNLTVRRHLGNEGHAWLAGKVLDVLKTGTQTTVPTAPTAPTGGSSYAFANPNPDYVGVADQGWLNQDQKFFDNGTVKIGILDAGGVIATARLMSNDRGLINTYKTGYNDDPADPRYNTITYDLGRSWMPASDYFSPDPDVGYQFKTKNEDGSFKSTKTGYKGNVFNTGGNTVQGGSLWPALTKSPILASAQYTHATRGREVYIKTRPAIWGVKGELGNIIVEEWISWARANVVHVYTRHTVLDRDPNQVDEQRLFRAREQENPCIYTIANLTQHLINLPGEPRKNIWPGNQTNPSFSSTYHTLDCKIGAYEGEGGTGLTLYSPMNSAFKSGHFGAAQGGEYDSQASYINGASRMNYDNPGIYDDENFVVVGSESDANAAIPQLPGIDQGFSFDFSQENMRWWNVDSRLKREAGNQWTWYLDQKTERLDDGRVVSSFQCKLQSPWRAWTAANIASISFEMAVTGASQLDMIWERPGPDNQPNFAKRFTVTGDGQFRTYTVATSDPNWQGTITNVGLQAVGSAITQNPGAKIILRKISKN